MNAASRWESARALLLTHVPDQWAGGMATVEEAIEDMVVFARDSPTGGRLEAASPKAHELLDGPFGPRVRQVLDGITSHSDSRPFSRLSTVTAVGRPEGVVPWFGMLDLAHGADPAVERTPEGIRNAVGAGHLISAQVKETELFYMRHYDGNLLATGATDDVLDVLTGGFDSVVSRSKKLVDAGLWNETTHANAHALLDDPTGELARIRRWDQLQAILHELEHADGDVTAAGVRRLLGLEEGTAEALSTWPGAVEEFAATLGIADEVTRPPVLPPIGFGGIVTDTDVIPRTYEGWRLGVTGYLELAGLDATDPHARSAARDLLRGVALVDVPERLAAGILRGRGVANDEAQAVLAAFIDANEPSRFAREVLEPIATDGYRLS